MGEVSWTTRAVPSSRSRRAWRERNSLAGLGTSFHAIFIEMFGVTQRSRYFSRWQFRLLSSGLILETKKVEQEFNLLKVDCNSKEAQGLSYNIKGAFSENLIEIGCLNVTKSKGPIDSDDRDIKNAIVLKPINKCYYFIKNSFICSWQQNRRLASCCQSVTRKWHLLIQT